MPEFSDFVFGYGDDEVEIDNPTESQVSVNKLTVNVTVDLDSISLNKTELNLEKGVSETLKVTYNPEAAGKGKDSDMVLIRCKSCYGIKRWKSYRNGSGNSQNYGLC